MTEETCKREKETGFVDRPLEEPGQDRLGLKKEVEALGAFILQCPTPMTIAIQGDWGTGKTSMMQMVRRNIVKHCECVWFNTWQFSQFHMQDDVPLALFAEFLAVVTGEGTKLLSILATIGRKLKSAAGSAAETATGIKSVGKLVEAVFREDAIDRARQLKLLEKELNTTIQEKLKSGGKNRVVVFIDDLDRMDPEKAVELLEVMKTFLNITGCVFVLAVDYGVISRGVRKKYGADMDEIKGRSFFDKIIQLPFNLPVARYAINNYLMELLGISREEVDAYKKLAAASVGTNPRALKRMANILTLFEFIAKTEEQTMPEQERRLLLFAALCLQMGFETVYAQMLRGENEKNLLEEKPDNVPAIFAEALEKAPGRKEEQSKRLIRFFTALNGTLSPLGEDAWERFRAVLGQSGLTASGQQEPLIVPESLENSFDPKLMARFAQLPATIDTKYQSCFALLGRKPTLADDGKTLSIPLMFASQVELRITPGEEGIRLCFYSTGNGDGKKAFKGCLSQGGVRPPAAGTERSLKAYQFVTFPLIPWESDNPKKERHSEERYAQTEKIAREWCDALLPGLERVYRPKAEAIARTENVIIEVEKALKAILPEEQGWIYERSPFGAMDTGSPALALRKDGWRQDVAIVLESEKAFYRKMYLGLKDGGYGYKKSRKNAFWKAWLQAMTAVPGIDRKNGLGSASTWVCYVYYPEGFENWARGTIDRADFSSALDESQEREILTFSERCAQAFAAVEAEMEAFAAEE